MKYKIGEISPNMSERFGSDMRLSEPLGGASHTP